MIKQNEEEEIIGLIYRGIDIVLLSFELDIPIEQVQECKKRLELRQSVKESITNGNIEDAIEKLNDFILGTENNIIEKAMLLKLSAYANNSNISEEDWQKIEEERKKIGFSNNIDKVLNDLNVQIPRRKSSNIKRKEARNTKKEMNVEEEKKEIAKPDYEEAINRYKKEIDSNPQKGQKKRNLLAFAYFKSGKIKEAKEELIALIAESNNYIAYRQLVHIEKVEGNLEEAKLWAYEALETFPKDVEIREQLISIAKIEHDNEEIIRQIKEVIKINPKSEKNKTRLQRITRGESR